MSIERTRKMKIVAYCRVSTDKEDQLNSLETQRKFFEEYAQKTGNALVKIYADEGISGTKTKNRKEFLRMMQDARRNFFDIVVVKDFSRMARNTVDFLQSVRELKSLGIETQFLNYNMTSMGESEFILTVFAAIAQEESANTSKRVKFGKKMNAEKGRVPNIVYGYDKTKGDYFNLEINQVEAKVVKQVFEWYTEEGYGAAKIAKMLNEQGLMTKRDCKWSQNAICRIISNEIYIGRIVNGKQEVADFLSGKRVEKDEREWITVERPELKIIENAQFEKAQTILQSRYENFKLNGERQSNKYLLSTLIKCKECGWSFRRVERKYKNVYVRWVCSGRNGQGVDSCSNKTKIDEQEMIDRLKEHFANILSHKKNVIQNVVNEFQRVYKAKDENIESEKDLKEQLAKIKRKRQKYMEMYEDDLISRNELKEKTEGMLKEISRLEQELEIVSYNLTKGEQLERILNDTFKQIEDISDVSTMTNAQLRKIVKKIEVGDDKSIDIYLNVIGELGLEDMVLIENNESGTNSDDDA